MDVSNYLYNDLSVLYDKPEQAQFLHSQSYVEGCLLGACACPEIPLPDVWLPWVIKHHQQIQNAQQADHITDILFGFFKQCLASMHNNSLCLPDYAVYSSSSVGGNSVEPLREWCEGILVAHIGREKVWQSAWNKMQAQTPEKAPQLAKDLKHCLLMFSTFADPEKAIEEANTKEGGGELLAQKLPVIAKSLQDTLHKYIAISGELAAFLPNQFETFQNQSD
jgi:uncharacterized protein